VLCLALSPTISCFSSGIEWYDSHSAFKTRRSSLIWTILQSYREWADPFIPQGFSLSSLTFFQTHEAQLDVLLDRMICCLSESKNILFLIRLPYKLIYSLSSVEKKSNKMGIFFTYKCTRRLNQIYSVSTSDLTCVAIIMLR